MKLQVVRYSFGFEIWIDPQKAGSWSSWPLGRTTGKFILIVNGQGLVLFGVDAYAS